MLTAGTINRSELFFERPINGIQRNTHFFRWFTNVFYWYIGTKFCCQIRPTMKYAWSNGSRGRHGLHCSLRQYTQAKISSDRLIIPNRFNSPILLACFLRPKPGLPLWSKDFLPTTTPPENWSWRKWTYVAFNEKNRQFASHKRHITPMAINRIQLHSFHCCRNLEVK